MKESDITKEVIAKAKEIALLWKMEIYVGCWWWNGQSCFLHLGDGRETTDWAMTEQLGESFPIPSISDCLEKLREFANENIMIFIDTSMIWFVTLDMYTKKKKTNESKSLHLAILSALLEVLIKGEDK